MTERDTHTIYFRVNDQPVFTKSGLTHGDYLRLMFDDKYTWDLIESEYGLHKNPNENPIQFISRSRDNVDFMPVDKRQTSLTNNIRRVTADSDDDQEDCIRDPTPSCRSDNAEMQDVEHGSHSQDSFGAIPSDCEKNPPKTQQKSLVWRYFGEKDKEYVTCNICNARVKHSGGTRNLHSHLENNHRTLNLSVVKKRTTFTSESSEGSTAGDEPMAKRKRFTSKNKLPKIDEAFKKVGSFGPGGAKSERITNAVLFVIAKDKQPLSMVQREGFQYLMKVVAPNYNLPSRKAITTLIDDKYVKLKEEYLPTLKKACSYTLSCDNWTDCTFQSYLGVTIHYLSESLEMKSGCLGVFPLHSNHTAAYLSDCLNSAITEFELEVPKIMAITSDGAANIRAATEMIVGPNRQIWCFAHCFSHIVPKLLKEMPELITIIENVRQFAVMIRMSIVATDELKRLQIVDGKTEGTVLKLILDVPTRWNSELFMLERFLLLEEYIPAIMRKCKKMKFPAMLTCDETEVLNDVVKLMKPVELVIREISGTTYATCSVIVPSIACLKKTLTSMTPTTGQGVVFNTKLLTKIDEKFSGVEDNTLLAISIILDPRFKKLHFEHARSVANAVDKIRREMVSSGVKDTQQKSSMPRQPDASDKITLWKSHDDLVAKSTDEFTSDESIPHELRQYLKARVIPRDEDPFKHWKFLQPSFPHLYELAIRYVSVVSTSVPSERLFSFAGKLKTLERNRLSGEHVNRLAFLGSLSKEDWHLD